MTTPRSLRHSPVLGLLAATLCCAGLSACASAPVPGTLQQVQDRLRGAESEQLSASQARLMKDARALERKAWRAYERGELDRAELQAHRALQMVKTASAFEGRKQAESKNRAMRDALDDIQRQNAQLSREQEALERYQAAQQRFEQVEQELAQIRASDRSAKANARRKLVEARRLQAEAIGEGAPERAPKSYGQGQAYLEAALQSLNADLPEESIESSDKAIESFKKSMAGVGEAVAAQSEKEARATAARDAIDRAQTARAKAIAERMPDREPSRYQEGSYLLELADSEFKRTNYDAAIQRAEGALAIFTGEAPDAGPRAAAQAMIQEAEQARALVLGRGLGNQPIAQQADYTLNLARQALGNGEHQRALEGAQKARDQFNLLASYAGVLPQGPSAPMGGGAPTVNIMSAGAPPMAPAAAMGGMDRRDVDRHLTAVEVVRAEALMIGRDKLCPDTFRGFEALLALAQQRYQRQDWLQAVAISTQAQERLKSCPMPEPPKPGTPGAPGVNGGPPGAAAAAAANTERDLTPQERRERDSASAALAKAQIRLAQAPAKGIPPATMNEARTLLKAAQQWYERSAWIQAKTLGEEVNTVLTKAEEELKKNPKAADPNAKPGAAGQAAKGPQGATTDPKGIAPKDTKPGGLAAALIGPKGMPGDDPKAPGASAKSTAPSTAAATAAPAPECATYTKRRPIVQREQNIASARVQTKAQDQEFRTALGMIDSADDLHRKNLCKPALMMLNQAGDALERIARIDDPKPSTPAKPDPAQPGVPAGAAATAQPQDPACKDLNQHLSAVQINANVAAARARTAQDQTQLTDGLRILQDAKALAQGDQCASSRRLSDVADAMFKRIGDDKAGPPAATAAKTAAPPKGASATNASDDAQRAAAQDAIARARILQASRESQANTKLYQTGTNLLRDSERKADAKQYAVATRLAQQAAFAFETLPYGTDSDPRPSTQTPAAKTDPARPAPNKGTPKTAAKTTTPKPDPAKTNPPKTNTTGSPAAQAEPWRPAYKKILDALVLRDRARDAKRTSRGEPALKRGNDFMAQSERFWDVRDWATAGHFAEAATEEFKIVLEAANAPDDAPDVDVDALQAKIQAASTRVRELEVLHARCQERDCAKRDPVRWGQVQARVADARAALQAKRYDEAEDIAARVTPLIEGLLNTPLPEKPAPKVEPPKPQGLTMPQNIGRVSIEGDLITLTPRITFARNTQLTRDALASIDELARVLKVNSARLSRVTLVGFTDDRGANAYNLRLSQQRAEAVRRELIRRGVADTLIVAQGRGEEDPIASNATPRGREQNRRVEVRVVFAP